MQSGSDLEILPGIKVGKRSPLLLIAGPCQVESEELCLEVANELKVLSLKHKVNLIFKASYDKANRTSMDSPRGPGLESGIATLATVKRKVGIHVLTDVHSIEQAQAAAQAVDVLQIPAFLCRQTDLLIAAGRTGKAINCKKGQFLHPADMRFAAEKIASTGNNKIMLCERGTCFGYRDLVVDPRSILIMSEIGYPVVFDASHSVQSMGGSGGRSGGSRQYIPALAGAAVALGASAVFVECHPQPDSALSDGASMLQLSKMDEFIGHICALRKAYLGSALAN